MLVKPCSTILWLLMLIALIGERSRLARADDTDDGVPPVVDKDFAKHAGHSKTDDESVIRKQESSSGAHLDGITADEMRTLFDKAEPHKFHTQEDRMMKLIINSLYKNKEIFLRELISNGSDALDKIKHQSITNPHVLDADPDLSIRIKVDPKNKMLHVIDSGVGMTKQHLEEYLGTIAKSETSEFLKAVEKGGDTEKVVSDLIGQFGVGFYSSFLVADKVVVTSKHNDDEQYVWESDSKEFKVMKDPRAEKLKRGTIVSLHLKEEAEEYLDLYQLRNIAIKYSQFVNYPIYIWNEKQVEEEAAPEETVAEPAEDKKEEKDEDVKVSDEDEKPKQKKKDKVKKIVWYWEHLNDVKPIWQRSPKEVSEEDYAGFYKALTKKSEEPLLHIHFSAEGEVNFRSVLFVPKTAPVQYGSSVNPTKPDNIKLYVRRVFISDQFDDFLPLYLSFVYGIVDSDDLPLNVSREMLQQHKLLKVIRKKITRKILDTLLALDEDKYEEFWKEFGTQIKFGLTQDSLNRGRLAKLLRFYSSAGKDKYTSLVDYVSRMRKDQKDIFYVAAASLEEAKKSPFVERVIRKGYEVLYLVDTADQFCLQNLPEFEGKKFQNVAKEGLKLDASDKAQKKREKLEEQYEPLRRYLEEAFSDKVLRVAISDRLVETPMVFVASQWGYDGNMERISLAQAAQKVGGDVATLHFANMKRRMEINPYHPVIKDLLNRVKQDKSDPDLREYAEVCVDIALIRSGYVLRDSPKFTERVENLLKESMKIPTSATVDREELDDEETPDEDELERLKSSESTKGDYKENVKALPGMKVMSISKKPAARNKRSSQETQKIVKGVSKHARKKSKSKRSSELGEKRTKNKRARETTSQRINSQVAGQRSGKWKRAKSQTCVGDLKKKWHASNKTLASNVNKKLKNTKKSVRGKQDPSNRREQKVEKRPPKWPRSRRKEEVCKISSKTGKKIKRVTNSSAQSKKHFSKSSKKSPPKSIFVTEVRPDLSTNKLKGKLTVDETMDNAVAKTTTDLKRKRQMDSRVEKTAPTVQGVMARTWQKLVSLFSLPSEMDPSESSVKGSNSKTVRGFAMALEIPERPAKHRKGGSVAHDIKLPKGVVMRNGKLSVGYRYRYRISNFLRSAEGRSAAKALRKKIPSIKNVPEEEVSDPRSRIVIRKPPVGYPFRYRISNYLKTLSPEDLHDLHLKGYLNPIIVTHGTDLKADLHLDALGHGGADSSEMVFNHIYRFLLGLISYKKCVEWKEVPLPPEKRKRIARNELTGKIGYEYRYRLSRKLEKLSRQHSPEAALKIKPPNVGSIHGYRVSRMLQNLNTSYEQMASLMTNNTWEAYRQEKETKFLNSRKVQEEVADKPVTLKLIGAPCPTEISVRIEDLYPPELIHVGYEYRYRRSRKMRAVGISTSSIEQKRWSLIEEQIRKNMSDLLKSGGTKSSDGEAQAKAVDGVFVLDYERLTPEERKVGYDYRYRISRKFVNQLPLYVREDLKNKQDLSKVKVEKMPELRNRHKRISQKSKSGKKKRKKDRSGTSKPLANLSYVKSPSNVVDLQKIFSILAKFKAIVRDEILREKKQIRLGELTRQPIVERKKKRRKRSSKKRQRRNSHFQKADQDEQKMREHFKSAEGDNGDGQTDEPCTADMEEATSSAAPAYMSDAPPTPGCAYEVEAAEEAGIEVRSAEHLPSTMNDDTRTTESDTKKDSLPEREDSIGDQTVLEVKENLGEILAGTDETSARPIVQLAKDTAEITKEDTATCPDVVGDGGDSPLPDADFDDAERALDDRESQIDIEEGYLEQVAPSEQGDKITAAPNLVDFENVTLGRLTQLWLQRLCRVVINYLF